MSFRVEREKKEKEVELAVDRLREERHGCLPYGAIISYLK